MDHLTMWSALVGALLPALVALVNREHWPAWAKGLTAVASSAVAGGVTAWLSGDLTGATWLQSTLIVAGATLASYRLWWHPTGVAATIEQAHLKIPTILSVDGRRNPTEEKDNDVAHQ